MINKQYDKLVSKTKRIPKRLVDIAIHAVDTDVRTIDGSPTTGGNRIALITTIAYSMALGEQSSKTRHMLLGATLGITATIGIIKIRKTIEKPKERVSPN